MWKQFATEDGILDEPISSLPVATDWIKDVAQMLIKADAVADKNERFAAILSAIGLAGKTDPYRALREEVESAVQFNPIIDGKEAPLTKAEKVNRALDHIGPKNLLKGVYLEDKTKAKDLIRKNLPK